MHCFGSGGCAGAALGLHYSLGAVVVVLPVVGAALGLRYSLVVVVGLRWYIINMNHPKN